MVSAEAGVRQKNNPPTFSELHQTHNNGINMKKNVIAACSFIFLTATANADICSKELLNKDNINMVASSNSQGFDLSFACSSTFKEFQSTKGAEAEFSYLKIGGSGSYNKSNYENFKQSNCNSRKTEDWRESMTFYASSILSPEAMQHYVECKKNESFGCSVQSHGEEYIDFIVYRGSSGAAYKINEGVAYSKNVKVLSNALKKGAKIKYGQQSLTVQRIDNKEVFFTLNVSTSTGANSCNGYVGPIPEHQPIPQPIQYKVQFKTNVTNFCGINKWCDTTNLSATHHQENFIFRSDSGINFAACITGHNREITAQIRHLNPGEAPSPGDGNIGNQISSIGSISRAVHRGKNIECKIIGVVR